MNSVGVIIIVVLAVAAIILGIWGYRRWRYVDSLRKRGWTFETSPSISSVVGLNHAPFGAGFEREVDDMVSGTASNGMAFRALEYDYDGWRSNHYVVWFPLPKSLPMLYVRNASRPSTIPGLPRGAELTLGGYSVLGASEDYARRVGGAVAGLMPELGHHEVSVDHANVVVFDVPEDVEALARAVEVGSRIAKAVVEASDADAAAPAPRHLSFNHRPHWGYLPRADDWLGRVPYTRGGRAHEAHDIVHGTDHGISFVRLEHRWKTDHRDKDGKTTTRNHREYLCQYQLGFPFQALDLGSNILGIGNSRSGIQFESAEFNDAYKVTAADGKFASDVLHPRMMEWLLRHGAPRISIRNNGLLRVPGGDWSVQELEATTSLLLQFFGRVPDFVWQNLGAWPRPVPEAE